MGRDLDGIVILNFSRCFLKLPCELCHLISKYVYVFSESQQAVFPDVSKLWETMDSD